jgi:tetratricopeptide (TPR) repeat protein
MINKWLRKRKTEGRFLDGTFQSIKGEYGKAIKTLSKAIEIDPAHFDSYLHRGIAYLESGHCQQAINDFSFVIHHKPDASLAFYNRSIAYMELGEKDLALADMDRAITLDPQDPGYYALRGIIQDSRQEYELALLDASKVVELGDGDTGHNNRAIVHEHKGDLLSAIADWSAVLELQPNSPKALCFRGRLLAKIGDSEAAIADLKRGLKKKGKLPEALRSRSEELLQELKQSSKKSRPVG